MTFDSDHWMIGVELIPQVAHSESISAVIGTRAENRGVFMVRTKRYGEHTKQAK